MFQDFTKHYKENLYKLETVSYAYVIILYHIMTPYTLLPIGTILEVGLSKPSFLAASQYDSSSSLD